MVIKAAVENMTMNGRLRLTLRPLMGSLPLVGSGAGGRLSIWPGMGGQVRQGACPARGQAAPNLLDAAHNAMLSGWGGESMHCLACSPCLACSTNDSMTERSPVLQLPETLA